MYSVVMMMALAGAAESPECGRLRCHGAYYSCSGCYGCSCSCTGYIYSGCTGCTGCYGYSSFRPGCYGCSCSCVGSMGYYTPLMTPPPPPPPGGTIPPPMPVPPKETRAPATIQINTPSDAVVYFDGYRTTVSGNRRFTTPALEQGKTYFYNVKIEMTHEGQTVTTTERVLVRAGDQAQVSFDATPTGIVSARQN